MPRLLTVRDAMRSSRYKAMEKRGEAIRPELLPDFAVHYVGGGGHIFLCPLHVINFSLLPPGKNFFAQVEFYKYPGWLSAPVVDFDRGADPKTILECGRAI